MTSQDLLRSVRDYRLLMRKLSLEPALTLDVQRYLNGMVDYLVTDAQVKAGWQDRVCQVLREVFVHDCLTTDTLCPSCRDRLREALRLIGMTVLAQDAVHA